MRIDLIFVPFASHNKHDHIMGGYRHMFGGYFSVSPVIRFSEEEILRRRLETAEEGADVEVSQKTWVTEEFVADRLYASSYYYDMELGIITSEYRPECRGPHVEWLERLIRYLVEKDPHVQVTGRMVYVSESGEGGMISVNENKASIDWVSGYDMVGHDY